MGLKDLFFGKEEEDEDSPKPESKENDDADDNRGVGRVRFGEPEVRTQSPQMPVERQPVAPEVPVSSPELEAELKEMKELMQVEKKDKGLGLEYYGYLKALGDEDDDDARQRTLRSVNAVREQFSVGQALTWNSLVDSAKTCMAWLSSHSREKTTKLQTDFRTVASNHTLQMEKAAMAIQEKEKQIVQLQREIKEQQAAQVAAKNAREKAELAFETKKLAINNASVQLATDIANDIAAFQRQH